MSDNLVLSNLKFELKKRNKFLKIFSINQKKKLTLKYHWSNKKKLNKDYKYLYSFYHKVIKFLVEELNKVHNIKYNFLQWEMILGPWLWRFIGVYYDKYETLIKTKRNYKINVLNQKNPNLIPNNYQHFIKFFLSKEWNYYIALEIINNLEKKNFKKNYQNKSLKIINSPQKKLNSNFLKFFNFLKSDKILIQSIGLKKRHLIRLFYLLKIFPFKQLEFESNLQNVQLKKINRNFDISKFKFKNKFERIFIRNIKNHIPLNFIEGFSYHLKFLEKLNYYPKNIITSQLHLNSDLFKLWISLPKMKKSNLYIIRHGGTDFIKENFEQKHELRISEKVFGAGEKTKKIINCVRPFLINKISNKTMKKNIILLDLERSPFNDLRFGTTSNEIPDSIKKTYELSKKIIAHPELREIFKIIPYSDEGYNSYKFYKKKLGPTIVKKPKVFDKELPYAKLIICRYPLTTYAQALYSAPTLLYINYNHWPFNRKFQKILPDLENKLIFYDQRKFLENFYKIYENPLKWWNSSQILILRKQIIKNIYKKNSIEELSKILKENILK